MSHWKPYKDGFGLQPKLSIFYRWQTVREIEYYYLKDFHITLNIIQAYTSSKMLQMFSGLVSCLRASIIAYKCITDTEGRTFIHHQSPDQFSDFISCKDTKSALCLRHKHHVTSKNYSWKIAQGTTPSHANRISNTGEHWEMAVQRDEQKGWQAV